MQICLSIKYAKKLKEITISGRRILSIRSFYGSVLWGNTAYRRPNLFDDDLDNSL